MPEANIETRAMRPADSEDSTFWFVKDRKRSIIDVYPTVL